MTQRADDGGLPGRAEVFGSLCVLVFLVNLGRVIYAPLLEPFRTTFGATPGQLGLLATLAWVGSAAPRFPTGYLLTKVPRHWVVLSTGLVLAGGSAFAAAANSLSTLYVGAVLMGLASGVYYVAASPLISELYPRRVGWAIGVNGTASQVAAVAAPVLVGLVLAVPYWPIAAWRVIFLLIGVAAFGSALLFAAAARRATLPSAGTADRNLLVALRAQWRLILTGIAIVGLTGMVWNGVFNLFGTYLVETKGFSEATSRDLLTVTFATGVPAFWLSGRLADRVPFVPLLFAILAGFVVTLVALVFAQGFVAVAAVAAVMGYVIHSLFPVTDTFLLASFPDEHRGSAYALFSGTMMPIQAAGSVLVGVLVDVGFAFDAVFLGLAVANGALVAGLALLYVGGRLPDGR
ncbi:MFS transporter [Salinilacihabitans rarus]|uniref:MFS transporter n=1 Tax=Salinilacihabitans rarus TaxID=2961596 RepID=UPI0020C91C2F|nr:MFS transporter [Salinilacihabitans rarus]